MRILRKEQNLHSTYFESISRKERQTKSHSCHRREGQFGECICTEEILCWSQKKAWWALHHCESFTCRDTLWKLWNYSALLMPSVIERLTVSTIWSLQIELCWERNQLIGAITQLCKAARAYGFWETKTKNKLGDRMIKQLLTLVIAKYGVSQINYLPQPSASANNWFARHWQIKTFCSTSSNNC